MKTNNLFTSIPEHFKDELIESLFQNSKIKIERIVSKGHRSATNHWYDQKTDEWVLLLKGSAIIAFKDNTEITLLAGDYINLPAHKQHRVEWTDSDQDTVWLAIHF